MSHFDSNAFIQEPHEPLPSLIIISYVQITFVSSMKNELYIMVRIAHQHHTTSGENIETKVQNMLQKISVAQCVALETNKAIYVKQYFPSTIFFSHQSQVEELCCIKVSCLDNKYLTNQKAYRRQSSRVERSVLVHFKTKMNHLIEPDLGCFLFASGVQKQIVENIIMHLLPFRSLNLVRKCKRYGFWQLLTSLLQNQFLPISFWTYLQAMQTQ